MLLAQEDEEKHKKEKASRYTQERYNILKSKFDLFTYKKHFKKVSL